MNLSDPAIQAALIGVGGILLTLLGSVFGYFINDYLNGRNEHTKLITALRAEIKANITAADHILTKNAHISPVDKRSNENAGQSNYNVEGWCEIIPLSELAWSTVIRTGALSRLDDKTVEAATNAFTVVKGANFIAEKILRGNYDRPKGTAYTERVSASKDALQTACTRLDPPNKTKKPAIES